ncbi:MAG: hypothetical protein IPM55_03250 [Acidobacteria bacterium]|nr:hypothetical protein [Acidobacteriota bacterium]
MSFRRLHDLAGIAKAEIGIDIQSELRQLDRDIRIDACGLDSIEHVQVLTDIGFSLGFRGRALAQMVECSSNPQFIERPNGFDSVIDVLSGDESARDMAESGKFREKSFQAGLARKVEKGCS